MRFLLFIFIACLLAHYCGAQNVVKDKAKTYLKKQIVPASLVFLSGMADGLNQALAYQYPHFKAKFPGANDRYWSPQVSFMNKYKNGDPKQGAKFPGSKGIFVFLSDAYHLSRFAEHLFLSGALAFKITGDRQKWWRYVLDALAYWGINRAGFALVYSQFK